MREFSIGMGPKVWWTRRHGTTFTIRILPLGGYVRMAGDEEDEEALRPGMPITIQLDDQQKVNLINTSDRNTLYQGLPLQLVDSDLVDGLWIKGYVNGDESQLKTYPVDHDARIIEQDGTDILIAPRDVQLPSASLLHRMMITFAGPFNNFILSLVAFVILGFTLTGIPTNSNQLGAVQQDSVAAQAGLKKGDRIVAVNGHQTKDWEALASSISSKGGQKISLTYQRGGQDRKVKVVPKKVKRGRQTYGQIGIREKLAYSTSARLQYGWKQFLASATLIFTVLGHMFTHGFSLNDLGGPVAMYAGTSQAAALGVNGVINFLALLSINLGIVNLLPIPALDGGKLLLNLIELVTRRPIPKKAENFVTLIGVAFLVILMILVTWNDIQRYFIR